MKVPRLHQSPPLHTFVNAGASFTVLATNNGTKTQWYGWGEPVLKTRGGGSCGSWEEMATIG